MTNENAQFLAELWPCKKVNGDFACDTYNLHCIGVAVIGVAGLN